MKKLKNTKAFSLIFAMGIVLSVSLSVIYLLEYVIPFGKDTKGIEFSSNAFYQGSSALEDALYFVAKRTNLAEEKNDPLEIAATNTRSAAQEGDSGYNEENQQDLDTDINVDMAYNMIASGSVIPPPGEGNSNYSDNWNALSSGEPLQIEVGENRWDNAIINFRVPDTGIGDSLYLADNGGEIVTWQLSSANDTLNAEASGRLGSENLKTDYDYEFNIGTRDGKTLLGTTTTFQNFYNNSCNNTGEKCTLKISIINELVLDDEKDTPVPFLEYQISGADSLPLRYTHIEAEGYSNGFKKDINIKVPQQTVNEAFDFTVFQ